jgi:hypothetical protein
VRRVPIPPQLVQPLREHVDQYGTGPAGQLFLTSFAAHGRTAVRPRVTAFVQLRGYFAWW